MIIMTDLSFKQVFQNLNVAGRMVKWAIELSKFDIQYEPRCPIKGHVYADFVVELSLKESEEKGKTLGGFFL